MRAVIRETCSCGAQLVFEESFEESYQSHASYRQSQFQTAHASCRPPVRDKVDAKTKPAKPKAGKT